MAALEYPHVLVKGQAASWCFAWYIMESEQKSNIKNEIQGWTPRRNGTGQFDIYRERHLLGM